MFIWSSISFHSLRSTCLSHVSGCALSAKCACSFWPNDRLCVWVNECMWCSIAFDLTHTQYYDFVEIGIYLLIEWYRYVIFHYYNNTHTQPVYAIASFSLVLVRGGGQTQKQRENARLMMINAHGWFHGHRVCHCLYRNSSYVCDCNCCYCCCWFHSFSSYFDCFYRHFVDVFFFFICWLSSLCCCCCCFLVSVVCCCCCDRTTESIVLWSAIYSVHFASKTLQSEQTALT